MEKKNTGKESLAAKLLSAALTELVTSRWTAGLSTRDNPMMLESISSALGFFERLFAIQTSISLNISGKSLLLDGTLISGANPFLQDFAGIMESKGVASLEFSAGLTLDELIAFQSLFITGETISENDTVNKESSEKISHVRITFSQPPDEAGQLRGDGVTSAESQKWRDYISAILSGNLSDFDAEVLIANIPPEEIASYMNSKTLQQLPQNAPRKIISTYVGSSGAHGVQPDLFEKFLVLVNALDPQLKRRFLLDTINSTKLAAREAETLFGSLTASELETFIDSLTGINEFASGNVAPVIDILNAIQSPSGLYTTMKNEKTVLPGCDMLLDKGSLSFFGEEQFSRFHSDEYRKTIKASLESHELKGKPALPELSRALNSQTTEKRFSEICLEVLSHRNVSRDDYLSILSRIANLATLFLESGRFDDFIEAYNTIYSDSFSGKYRDDASSMLNHFYRSQDFLEKAIEVVKVWGRHDIFPVSKFVEAQHNYLLSPLFDALADEQDAAIRNFLLELLSRLSFSVLDEAVKRLEDPRWYVIRNMLYVIRIMEGSRYSHVFKKFVTHMHPKVSNEALEGLLHFRNPDAVMYLKKALLDSNAEKRDEALRLAGEYKVRAVIPTLTALLEKVEYITTGPNYKLLVVKAMHSIAAPEAIPVFLNVLNSSSVLNVGALEELRLEIYRGLDRYPIESIRKLLTLGKGSSNSKIREISERLMQKDWKR